MYDGEPMHRVALAVVSVQAAGRLAHTGFRSAPAVQAARATAQAAAATRQLFIEAMQRAALGLPESADPAALRAYPLYEYLLAARLQRQLQQTGAGPDMLAALDVRIDAFLRAHAGQPVTRGLQDAWLASLAARGRWDWFLPRAAHVTDPALLCDRLAGRLATGDTATLAPAALALWREPLQQPAACDGVFEWLARQGLLTPALRASRARAALAAGNARLGLQFAAAVADAQAAPLRQWARLLQAPKPALTQLAAHPAAAVEPAALQAGFYRLTLLDSSAAAALLPRLLARPDMTGALRAQLQRATALGLAYDHDPAATAAFAAVRAPADDASVQQWRVRAALWIGDYRQALDWIEQMPAALAAQPRWRYWRARMTEIIAGPAAAQPLYAQIAPLRDYYGYLAADRLQLSYQLNAQPSPDEPAMQAALAAQPGLVRARELYACGLYDAAVVEWAAALAGTAPAVKVQAAQLAASWGWYTQSIATLAQADEWNDVRLRYPRPYPAALAAASALTRLPTDWILAVMRQESLFRDDAVSSAQARGVMQLRLATATQVAQRWHLPSPDADSLFDPMAEVPLGAAHLRELLDRYGGQLALALAAYNAGTTPVARWLPRQPMAADVWIENIPYNETRAYVEHILEHIVAYGWIRDAQPPRLAALLEPVKPADMPTALPPAPPALSPATAAARAIAARAIPR
jgi:soluble lytic murein transglycosylase